MSSWLWTAVAHAQCVEPEPLLDTLEQEIVEGRLMQAEATAEAVVAAFGCGAVATKESVARLWLAEAVMASARGETVASDAALAAASRLSPGTWSDSYGPVLRQRWDAAGRSPAQSPGRVDIGELPSGYRGFIDGTPLLFPAELSPGLHLLQVGGESMVYAKRFDLPSGLDLVIDTLMPVTPVPKPDPISQIEGPAPQQPAVLDRRKRRVIHSLVVGLAAGLVYGASAATGAAYQEGDDGLRTATNGLVLGSIGLGATSGVMLVRGIVSLPASERPAP